MLWNHALLREAERLTAEDLTLLARQERTALRVKQFITPELARTLSQKILQAGYEHYANAPSIGRIGMAFYEAEGDAHKMAQYFEQAAHHQADLRERCAPLLSPIDLLRCTLDEVWPAGAMLETLYGRKMYVGLSRVVEPEVSFLAHHDIFAKDAPNSFTAHSLHTQMACNVYLHMPEAGGHLQIWGREMSADEFDALRQDSYGIDPESLGTPQLDIQPQPGDLIIFNSRLMHAVTAGRGDLRLSLSCFVGYRGPAAPLTFWS